MKFARKEHAPAAHAQTRASAAKPVDGKSALAAYGPLAADGALSGLATEQYTAAQKVSGCPYGTRTEIAMLEAGLLPLSRKTCPVCQSELRAAAGEIRADTSQYVLGLRKVEGSW